MHNLIMSNKKINEKATPSKFLLSSKEGEKVGKVLEDLKKLDQCQYHAEKIKYGLDYAFDHEEEKEEKSSSEFSEKESSSEKSESEISDEENNGTIDP